MRGETWEAALVLLSDLVVRAVHSRDPGEIDRVVRMALTLDTPEGVDPAVALIVALAAQVPPGWSLQQRLEWTERLGVVGSSRRPSRFPVTADDEGDEGTALRKVRQREHVLTEWVHLRGPVGGVGFDEFAARVGMSAAAWDRLYQRARADGDPRATKPAGMSRGAA